MAHPPVIIVDTNDQVVGEAKLDEARQKGFIYRLVFVVAIDKGDRVLLQKRSTHMQLYPSCWDVSAGGHVDDGHGYEEAASYELDEELGVRGVTLHEMGHFYSDAPLWGGILAKRFCKVYRIALDTLPEQLGEEEVEEVRWFTKDELRALVKNHPERVAEGLERSMPYILEVI